MRIRRFSFKGVRGLDGFAHELPRSKDTDLTVVHGGPASGKTTFLDSLAAAKERIVDYGPPDARWSSLPASRDGAAKIEIDWDLADAERERFGLSDPLQTTEAILGRVVGRPNEVSKPMKSILSSPGGSDSGSMHYFHDSRALAGPLSFGAGDAARAQRLTTKNAKYADLYDLLDQPERGPARALASERLRELFPKIEVGGLRRSGLSFLPMVRDRASGAERSYHELSSSEQQAFLFALYTSKSPITDSVVFVDAPELGFGDEGAADLVRALLRWTTRTQLIVATASRSALAMSEVNKAVVLPT